MRGKTLQNHLGICFAGRPFVAYAQIVMSTPSPYYAHSPAAGSSTWQPLDVHLSHVAHRAAEFARPFGGEQWAYLAGLWHDLGKYDDAFQRRLRGEKIPVVHSNAGGHLASLKGWQRVDRVLSWLIMGHHAGLADFSPDKTGKRSLSARMREPDQSTDLLGNVPEWIRNQKIPTQDLPKGADPSLFIRMLFSCLVDADFLDTEAFLDEKRKALRAVQYPSIAVLLERFDQYMDALCSEASPTDVNMVRSEVLAQCRAAADGHSAVYSLSVPTGGGKTLASMGFALRHAYKQEKRRIIYVIPYTSIIEQTADVFRQIPGFETAVLEQHSNVQDEDETRQTRRNRLAAENWDAPIVITTNVQFFESLYASRTSRCRKLHNIVDSVIIFDEIQCLPPPFLRPCIFAIRDLQRFYGVTPVLCTATQPVLDRADWLAEGFERVVPIISDPDVLSARLKRVALELYEDGLEPVGLARLAQSLMAETESVLCIVNRKEDARKLAQMLPERSTIHLSTNLCAAHRMEVLQSIRTRLMSDERIFLVSTSLVEAGVDLDFPVVYRALAGLDSIAQAAGRCNREGRLPVGKTVVFLPESQPDYVRRPADIARELIVGPDPLTPENYTRYFCQRYWQLGKDELDQQGILDQWLRRKKEKMNLYYRTAADRFHMIDDSWQQSLIIPYNKAPQWIDQLLDLNARSLFRKLQRYTIRVPKQVLSELVENDYARELPEYPGTYYLHSLALYSERFGFIPPAESEAYEVSTNIV